MREETSNITKDDIVKLYDNALKEKNIGYAAPPVEGRMKSLPPWGNELKLILGATLIPSLYFVMTGENPARRGAFSKVFWSIKDMLGKVFQPLSYAMPVKLLEVIIEIIYTFWPVTLALILYYFLRYRRTRERIVKETVELSHMPKYFTPTALLYGYRMMEEGKAGTYEEAMEMGGFKNMSEEDITEMADREEAMMSEEFKRKLAEYRESEELTI